MRKKLQFMSVLMMIILLTSCSSKSPSISNDKQPEKTDTEKLKELVGKENESWVSLIVLNNSSTETDFAYYDVPEDSASFILAPGEKLGDDKNGESYLKMPVLKNVDSLRYNLLDNNSGENWYFDIKPEYKAIIVTVTDGDPYNLDFQYMDDNGQMFNY